MYLILFLMQDIAVCYLDACVRVLPTAKIDVSGVAVPLAAPASGLGGAPGRDIHGMAVRRCISVWNWFAPTSTLAAHPVAFEAALPSAGVFASLTKHAIDNTFAWSHKQHTLTHAGTLARLAACVQLTIAGGRCLDASAADTAQTVRSSKVFKCVCVAFMLICK